MIDTITGINKEVSKELGFSEDLIKKVNKFFWEKGVKNSIRSGDYTNIRVRGLGTFSTSRYKLNREIEDLIRLIRGIRNRTEDFKVKTKEEVIAEQYIVLKGYLKRRNELAVAYYEKQIRYHNKLKRNAEIQDDDETDLEE